MVRVFEPILTAWLMTGLTDAVASGTCSHTVNGHSIDLSPLKGKTISKTEGDWTYYFTPCQDGLSCDSQSGEQVYAMADQYKMGNDFCTAYLAQYSREIEPKYNNGVFTFTWNNGQAGNACEELSHHIYI